MEREADDLIAALEKIRQEEGERIKGLVKDPEALYLLREETEKEILGLTEKYRDTIAFYTAELNYFRHTPPLL